MTKAQRKDLEAMKAWNEECERIIRNWRQNGCVGTYVLPNAPKPPPDEPRKP